MASQFRKRRKLPVMSTRSVTSKRFKKVKTPLVYPPVRNHECQQDNFLPVKQENEELSSFNSDYDDSSPLEKADLSSHYQRREKAVAAWDNLLSSLIVSSVSMNCIPPSSVCGRCKIMTASVRCKQCGATTFLCDRCTIEHHSDEAFLGNAFHTPEKWINGQFRRFKFPSTLVLKTNHSCPTQYKKSVVCVAASGIQHQLCIVFCYCEAEPVTLLRLNLWAATPTRPTLAFSIDLLVSMKTLLLDGQVAVMDFAQALETYSKWLGPDYPQIRKVYPAIIDSFEEFRYYHYKLYTLDGISSVPDDVYKCPACPQEDEAASIVHISYDGLFGLCRKKAAGASMRNPHHKGTYFVDQEEVDDFINSYPSTKSSSKEGCNDFLAGSVVRSRQRYSALDETAVAGLACRHEYPLKFLNFKFGERIGYAVLLLEKLLELYPNDSTRIMFLYDIGCLLKRHLDIKKSACVERFKFAVPVFHSYGHVAQCQLEFSPRFQEGFGLTDGEVLERLWSYMRQFSKMTKEMRPSHRIDVLSDALAHFAFLSSMNLGNILVERIKKAENIFQSTLKDLEALRTDSTGEPVFSLDDIKRWYAEDKSKEQVSTEGTQSWQESYVELLQSFWAIQCDVLSCADLTVMVPLSRKLIQVNQQLQQIERQNGINERWKAGDEAYDNFLHSQTVKRCSILFKTIQSIARQRWFMLLVKAKFSAGHTMTHKISKNVTKTTKQLKKTIADYNKAASECVCFLDQESLPNNITWEMVSNIHSHLWVSSSTLDYNVPADIRRDAINKYYLHQRAEEEIALIKIEMSRYFISIHRRIEKLTFSFPSTPSCEQTVLEIGKSGLINARVRELCLKVIALRKLFQPYCQDAHQLPKEALTCDAYSLEMFDEEQQSEIDYWHSIAEEHFERIKKLQSIDLDEETLYESTDESDGDF